MCDVGVLFHPQNGYSPLYMGSRHGQTEVVDILLKSGADPNLATNVMDIAIMYSGFFVLLLTLLHENMNIQ